MKTTTAYYIIENAREQLIEFMRCGIAMLYLAIHKKMPNFSKDEEVVIYNYDLLTTPNILLWIENGTENGVFESLRLHSVKLLLDNSIVFEIEDGNRILGGEFTIDKISTDELADIANAIQATYNDIITRK